MLKSFTRYQPPVEVLSSGGPRVLVAVGATSGSEIARRSAEALAERLGTSPVVFPGDHGGFMADPAAFAGTIRQLLAESREDLMPSSRPLWPRPGGPVPIGRYESNGHRR